MNYAKEIWIRLNTLINWFKRTCIWFWHGLLFWIYLILLLIILTFGKPYYSIIGNVLQFIGVIIIFIGINKKIKFFNNQTPWQFYSEYFKKFPRINPKIQLGNLRINIQATSSLEAKATKEIKKPEENFTDVIRYLEEELLKLHESLTKAKQEFQDDIVELRGKVTIMSQQTDSKIKNVETKLLFSNISNINWELFGAGCIGAGLIFSILSFII